MRIINLTITNADGTTTVVPYAFADEGKVLVDKDGHTVISIESKYIDEYTEVDEQIEEDISAEEALGILLGENNE